MRFFLVLALVLLTTVAFAAEVNLQYECDDSRTWEWTLDDWGPSGDYELNVQLDWHVGCGSENTHTMLGYMPDDPIVSQVITNFSTATWTDWHVSLTNASIQPGSAWVRKQGDSTYWDIEYYHDDDGITGFFALGNPPAEWVERFQKLEVYFVFDPRDPNQSVNIQQFPTDDLIPEPGSLLALGMGLGSLGFVLRRKR